MADQYEPISCDVHDQLEAAAVTRQEIELVYDDQGVQQRQRGQVADVFVREGAEFARLRNGDGEQEIRLDQIVEVHEFQKSAE